MIDYMKAHSFANNHMAQLKQDSICGCFHCERIFHPAQITDWIIADNDCDRLGTAICPHCGVDAVIGESSGFPITGEFLSSMRRHWFGTPEKLRKNPLRMDQYLTAIRPLIDALWGYVNDELSWDALRTLLEERQRQPSFGVKLDASEGWMEYVPPETIYATEYSLMEQILCSGPAEAKNSIEAFFRSEPEMTAERAYILARRHSWSCPPFLQWMIGPLYGYLFGKVPYEGIRSRVELALQHWLNHEQRDILEESYWPEYELMCDLITALKSTTVGDADSEAAFRQAILSAMESYARKPADRRNYVLF